MKSIVGANKKTYVVFALDVNTDIPILSNPIQHISIDCEMSGLKPWRDKLFKIQICINDETIYILSLNHGPHYFPNLNELLYSDAIIKNFFFGVHDIAFLLNNLSLDFEKIKNVFCSKIASKVLRNYVSVAHHSLSSNVLEAFNIPMDKSLCHINWSLVTPTDILSKDEICKYMINDVIFLNDLRIRFIAIAKLSNLEIDLAHIMQCIPKVANLYRKDIDISSLFVY